VPQGQHAGKLERIGQGPEPLFRVRCVRALREIVMCDEVEMRVMADCRQTEGAWHEIPGYDSIAGALTHNTNTVSSVIYRAEIEGVG
jgi:hypothetical protein